MKTCRWLAGAVLALLLAPLTTFAANDPTIVVRVASIESMLKQGEYLAKFAGREEEAKQSLGFVRALAGEKGLEGVDIKRPFALYAHVTENVLSPKAYVLIPIADKEAFLNLLKNRIQIEMKETNGIYSFSVPNAPVSVFFKFANQHAYFTVLASENLEDRLLPAPEKVFTKTDNLIEVKVRLDAIPESIKKLVLGQVETQMANDKKKDLPGGTNRQKEFRNKGIDSAMAAFKSMLFEGKEFSLGLAVDEAKEELRVDWNMTAVEGSALAKDFNSWKDVQSIFSHWNNDDTGMRGCLSLGVPASLRSQLAPIVDEVVEDAINKADPQAKGMVERLMKAFVPTMKKGELDTGVIVSNPNKEGHITVAVGLKLESGTEIEKAIKDVVGMLPGEFQNYFQLDAEKNGDTQLHQLKTAEFVDANMTRVFGNKANVWLAIQNDRLIAAFGPEAKELLKTSLSKSSGTSALAKMDFSVARLAPLADPENREAALAVAESVFGKTPKGDVVRVRLTSEDGLKFRITIPAKVITFATAMQSAEKK